MDTRAVNMQRRRERILEAARTLITEQGYDALSTRTLAQAAGVSAPTLYNLIGNKAEILEALEIAAAEQVEARIKLGSDSTAFEIAQAIIAESVAVFSENEGYFRAAIVAGDRLVVQNPDATKRLDEKAVQLARDVCAELLERDALRGTIDTVDLATQLYSCYGAWLHDWGYGRIDLAEFARQTMRGFCLILSADATDAFRDQLLKHFQNLQTPGTQERIYAT